MSALVSFLPESPVAVFAAVGLHLLVAFGPIVLSLALGAAISLLIGLPALVTDPRRAIRARINRNIPK
jgi:hypothetical protein